MTIPEIRALREELEVALRQAFSDFRTRTGLAVEKVEVAHRVLQRVGVPDKRHQACAACGGLRTSSRPTAHARLS